MTPWILADLRHIDHKVGNLSICMSKDRTVHRTLVHKINRGCQRGAFEEIIVSPGGTLRECECIFLNECTLGSPTGTSKVLWGRERIRLQVLVMHLRSHEPLRLVQELLLPEHWPHAQFLYLLPVAGIAWYVRQPHGNQQSSVGLFLEFGDSYCAFLIA